MIRYTVEKQMGRYWSIVDHTDASTAQGGYPTKKAAEADLAVAQAVAAFFAAATAPQYTRFDHLVDQAAYEVLYVAREYRHKLETVADRLTRDAARLDVYGSNGNYVRQATDLDEWAARYAAAWKNLRELIYVAQDFPGSHAHISTATAMAFAALGGR